MIWFLCAQMIRFLCVQMIRFLCVQMIRFLCVQMIFLPSKGLFFFDANCFFWCAYHVEILERLINLQGIFFLIQINFYFDAYGDFFFDLFFFFFLILHPSSWHSPGHGIGTGRSSLLECRGSQGRGRQGASSSGPPIAWGDVMARSSNRLINNIYIYNYIYIHIYVYIHIYTYIYISVIIYHI